MPGTRNTSFCLLAVGILSLGIFLRVTAVWMPDPAIDNALRLYFSKFGFWETWGQLYRAEIHPPGYLWLLHYWQKAVGFHYGLVTTQTLRLVWLSVIPAYLLGSLGVWLVGREAGLPRKWNLALLALFASNLFFVWTLSELRPYVWSTALFLVALYYCLKAIRTAGNKTLLGWVLTSAAATYFHYYAFFPIATQAAFLLWEWRRKGRSLAPLFLSFAAIGVLVLPSVLILANGDKLRHLDPVTYWMRFDLASVPWRLQRALLPAVDAGMLGRSGFFPWAFQAIAFVSLSTVLSQSCRSGAGRIVAVHIALPVVGLLALRYGTGQSYYLDRHFSYVNASLVLALVLGLREAWGSSRRFVQGCGLVALTLCVFDAGWCVVRTAPMAVGYLKHPAGATDVFRHAREVEAMGRPGTVREAICSGRAAFSTDYLTVDLLLYFCPERFARLQNMDAQLRLPSNEWRDLTKAPDVLVYVGAPLCKKLFGTPEHFFERYAEGSPSEFQSFRTFIQAPVVVWIRKSLVEPERTLGIVSSIP